MMNQAAISPPGEVEAWLWIDRYFWGTGHPEDAAAVFAEIMGLFRRRPDDDTYYLELDAIEAFEAAHGRGIYCFMMYLMANLPGDPDDALIDFGTGVYQGWLTPLGEQVKRLVDADPGGFYDNPCEPPTCP